MGSLSRRIKPTRTSVETSPIKPHTNMAVVEGFSLGFFHHRQKCTDSS